MKKFTVEEISGIALITAGLVALGFLLYLVAGIFPFPGSKIIIMAALLGFAYTLLLWRYPRPGSQLAASLVFGTLMALVSPIMTAAIWAAGLITEVFLRVLRGYNRQNKIPLYAAIFPLSCWFTFTGAFYLFVDINLIRMSGVPLMIMISFLIYLLGYLGGRLAAGVFPAAFVERSRKQN